MGPPNHTLSMFNHFDAPLEYNDPLKKSLHAFGVIAVRQALQTLVWYASCIHTTGKKRVFPLFYHF